MRWQTIDADLILLGDVKNNPPMYDQWRGGLLADTPGVSVTHSPFVGERQALNIVADDMAGLEKSVATNANPFRVGANMGF